MIHLRLGCKVIKTILDFSTIHVDWNKAFQREVGQRTRSQSSVVRRRSNRSGRYGFAGTTRHDWRAVVEAVN